MILILINLVKYKDIWIKEEWSEKLNLYEPCSNYPCLINIERLKDKLSQSQKPLVRGMEPRDGTKPSRNGTKKQQQNEKN